MAAVTRKYLRNLARLYADGRPGGSNAFVVDSDAATDAVSLDSIVNLKLASLYDLLVLAGGHDYYAADTTIALVANTATYSLAGLTPPFYQALTLHLSWSPLDNEPVADTSQLERLAYLNWTTWARWSPKAFRLRGAQGASAQTLEFFPTPTIAVNAILRYVPAFVPLADDVTTFDSVNGWENLVALAAAIDYRAIAEKPNADLVALYQVELDRVRGLADKRAALNPPQVVQTNPEFRTMAGEFLGDRRWI